MAVVRKQEQWRVYKPRKDGSGAASRVEMKIVSDEREGRDGKPFTLRDVQMFWVMSPQVGYDSNHNASFSWKMGKDDKQSVTLKLGENDIGEILAVLTGLKEEAGQTGGKYSGIYHQSRSGSTTLQFKLVKGRGYQVRLARKPKEGNLQEVKHTLSFAEGCVLKVLLERAIEQKYQW
jgi:hypothetical protein